MWSSQSDSIGMIAFLYDSLRTAEITIISNINHEKALGSAAHKMQWFYHDMIAYKAIYRQPNLISFGKRNGLVKRRQARKFCLGVKMKMLRKKCASCIILGFALQPANGMTCIDQLHLNFTW